MALIEVNLKKPAIIEERPGTGESAERRPSARETPASGGGGRKAKLVGLLVVLFGIGLLVAKLKGRGETEMETGMDAETGSADESAESMDESAESQSASEGGSAKKLAGALGLVVAVASVAVAARKRSR